ncbi:hypothetical protein BT69DRAFT_1288513, partial [Atractiella rhizophila]
MESDVEEMGGREDEDGLKKGIEEERESRWEVAWKRTNAALALLLSEGRVLASV